MCSHHPTPVAWGDKDEWEAVLEEPSFLLWWLPVSSPVPQVAWQRVKWSPLGLWALAWIPRSLILKAWEVGPTITSFPLPQITHLGMPGLSPAFWMTKSGNLLENDSLQVAELLKSHSQGLYVRDGKTWWAIQRSLYSSFFFFFKVFIFQSLWPEKSVFTVSMNFSHIPAVVVKIWLSTFP